MLLSCPKSSMEDAWCQRLFGSSGVQVDAPASIVLAGWSDVLTLIGLPDARILPVGFEKSGGLLDWRAL